MLIVMFRGKRFACRSVAILFALVVLAFTSPAAKAQQVDASQFLPESTGVFVHIKSPSQLIDRIQNHQVVMQTMELPQVKQLLESPQFSLAVVGQKLLEGQLGEPILDTLKENTSQGAWLALDTKTEGAILIIRAEKEDRLKRVAAQVLKFIASAAKQQDEDFEIKRKDYRGASAAEIDKILIARYKDWFLICNKPDLAKQFVDNVLDGNENCLSNQTWFQEALANRGPDDIWTAANLDTVRTLSNNEAFSGRTDNPAVELIFGGILDLLKESPSITAGVNVGNEIDIDVRAPFKTNWANESREYFYGRLIKGRAPKTLQPKNLIASLTSYRDLGQWWLSKEELYAEKVIAQLAQADSQLSTIFSGMDFGQDVLGALEPGVQILVTQNTYESENEPDIKVPAFALVGKLKDAKRLQRKLKVAFQSVIGLANLGLGMNGQPQLDIETESIESTKLTTASYYIEEGAEQGLILYNFAPTIAFEGDNIVISSNRALAVELASLSKDDPSATEKSNTKLKIDGRMLHKILNLNKESLVAQNMLEEGNDRDQAIEQIQLVLSIVKLFHEANIEYHVDESSMELDLQVRFKE